MEVESSDVDHDVEPNETKDDANIIVENGKESDTNKDVIISLSDDDLEQKHFQRIVTAFRSYKVYSLKRQYGTIRYMGSLPDHQQALLRSHRSHLDQVRRAIEHNYEIIKLIVQDVNHLFKNTDHTNDTKVSNEEVRPFDMDKVQSILKQLFREWSIEGREERDASFGPILAEIADRFPTDARRCSDVHILVPGAGLGRLPYEIAKLGYTCQGNEFSLFMLFTSNFVLNKCQGRDLFRMYPWVHQFHNNLKSDDQLRAARFPDVDPCELPHGLEFSMAAGSYLEIYSVPDSWDCIASCFFLDTANNVLDYIEKTWNILKPGGFWINLGPLLYHHSDLPNEKSIEPSYEEIRDIIVKYGFNILKENVNIPTPYSQNPLSMMLYEYKSIFFVCQKPES